MKIQASFENEEQSHQEETCTHAKVLVLELKVVQEIVRILMLPNIALSTNFIQSPKAFELERVGHEKEDDAGGDPGEEQVDLNVEPVLVLRGVVVKVRVDALQIHRVEDRTQVTYGYHCNIKHLHKVVAFPQLKRLEQYDDDLCHKASEVGPFQKMESECLILINVFKVIV